MYEWHQINVPFYIYIIYAFFFEQDVLRPSPLLRSHLHVKCRFTEENVDVSCLVKDYIHEDQQDYRVGHDPVYTEQWTSNIGALPVSTPPLSLSLSQHASHPKCNIGCK